MDIREKALEQFHYFNIESELDSIYGNWAVSSDGDVVNSVFPYAILSIHFDDEDWVRLLRKKVWFKPECESCLMKALDRAGKILEKVYDEKQSLHSYSSTF